ncbi:NAD(P)/FAD-dependent oxidoreductase [Kineosporia sp. A_224]|uniref:flavin-containing monooxygenase n=1 Tax=Kineosporia sp. A_224 TaxID=1962180 RepID=UPI000B4C083C|nr:NAD(P)/FAD-dependent oxidoreductase [Kineosporia sp. A_224]
MADAATGSDAAGPGRPGPGQRPEHLDVLVVGAGLSGVGAACRLRTAHPGRSLAVLEAREAIGGTWDLFRYPGVRSDSDMHTLGYAFRPWRGDKALADGDSIREYVVETARAYGVDRLVRFGHRVVSASWSGADARWTVRVLGPAGEVLLTCTFLYICSGYYDYGAGYTPDLPGVETFAGTVVHPQAWPAGLDCAGKRVVVLGSGATAVTLVPALAGTAAHVTMLQRSPTWVLSLPGRDPVAGLLRRALPQRAADPAIRWKNILAAQAQYAVSRRRPELMKSLLLKGVRAQLPEGYDVATHFTPRYAPWDERLCFVPDGDLFRAVASGRASVVTDTVDTFVPEGVRTSSGEVLPADVVVTATGLVLLPVGGIALSVDGEPVDVAQTVAYKAMMLTGVPNLAFTVGYTNASWTLKADLVAEYVCRLLTYMDRKGLRRVVPVPPPTDERLPLLDLRSGYVRRGLDALPKQGPRAPWRVHQNYVRDRVMFRRGRVDDEGVRFG